MRGTVNPVPTRRGGSNPPSPTKWFCRRDQNPCDDFSVQHGTSDLLHVSAGCSSPQLADGSVGFDPEEQRKSVLDAGSIPASSTKVALHVGSIPARIGSTPVAAVWKRSATLMGLHLVSTAHGFGVQLPGNVKAVRSGNRSKKQSKRNANDAQFLMAANA